MAPDQDRVGVPIDVDRHDIGKDVTHGGRERLDQPEVGAGATGIDDGDAAGPEMSGDFLEEFTRGELERDVGLAIGVDANQVECRIGRPQGVAPIGDDDVDVFELVQREVLPGDIIDLGIDLDARDRDRAVGGGQLPGDRAASQPDEEDILGFRQP